MTDGSERSFTQSPHCGLDQRLKGTRYGGASARTALRVKYLAPAGIETGTGSPATVSPPATAISERKAKVAGCRVPSGNSIAAEIRIGLGPAASNSFSLRVTLA
jgi:hypothetical protein